MEKNFLILMVFIKIHSQKLVYIVSGIEYKNILKKIFIHHIRFILFMRTDTAYPNTQIPMLAKFLLLYIQVTFTVIAIKALFGLYMSTIHPYFAMQEMLCSTIKKKRSMNIGENPLMGSIKSSCFFIISPDLLIKFQFLLKI